MNGNFRLTNKLDRYIMKKFLGTYFLCIILIIAISVVFDFSEHVDKLMDASVKEILFDYYLNFIPYYANLFSQLFVFIAVIFFTSKIAENSEIIAMFSIGLSFKRMLRPYMMSTAIIALLSYVLSAYIIPVGSVTRIAFENEYINSGHKGESARNIQIVVEDGVIAYLESYQDYNNTGYRFCLDRFEDKILVSHMTAKSIVYDTIPGHKNHWTAKNYLIRNMEGDYETVTSGLELDTVINMEPADFLIVEDQQMTMTSPELRKYIKRQRERGLGESVRVFDIEYQKRIAMAFASFILTLIGVSLSSRKRKGGMGLHLGIGIGLSFGYILFQSVSSMFAVTGSMSAFWSVWIPNIVYIPIAVYLYIKAPK